MGGLLQSAHWPFLIDVYFFLGGLAGGAFVIATAALIVDSARYRDVSRVGYYLALVALVPCPVILIVDLGVPVRFMNMVMTFNPRSPMSMGAWALLGFSAAAFLAALLTLLEDLGKARSLSRPKTVIGVVGLLFAPIVARTVRAAVLAERELDYVQAARLRGESGVFIMTREILPNVTGPIIVELTVRIGYAIFTISTLSFLGVGLQPPSPDWGLMISEEYSMIINGYWWTVFFPSLAIASLVIAANLIADALQAVIQE